MDRSQLRRRINQQMTEEEKVLLAMELRADAFNALCEHRWVDLGSILDLLESVYPDDRLFAHLAEVAQSIKPEASAAR